ncbi:hypothetical protein OAB60_00805 [Flavobacteriaceae bacterium]|nr:hypothetical protein [Flavobacteriaceae bacterium]
MKKLLLLLLFIPLVSFGQDTIPAIPLQPLIKTVPTLKTEVPEKYKLYPTDNTYNHLMLDTASGAIWQVQWSTESETRFKTVISIETLVPRDDYEWLDDLPAGRFKLYPTKNTYTFLLLDVKLGRTWQVQWSFEANERFIIPIY